jgi:hypothetical protein
LAFANVIFWTRSWLFGLDPNMLLLPIVIALSAALQPSAARSVKRSNLYDASVRSQLALSPLQVKLQHSATPGKVEAVITNRGLSTAYFSTWLNPLSQNEQARKVDVLNTIQEPVQFLNAEGLPTSLDIPDEYEILPIGVSTVREIDIASNYELESGKEYLIQAGGFVPFRREGEATWTNSAAYETNVLRLTAPEDIHVHAPVDFAEKYILQTCEDATLMQKLNVSIALAAKVAKVVAEKTAAGKNKDAFAAYFIEDTPEARKKVADRYTAIYKTLTDNKGPTKIACRAQCTGYYAIGAAWTGPTTGLTEICPAMKSYPAEMRVCNRMNWPGVLLHELSHSGILFKPSTADTAQGSGPCKKLTARQAIANADTFNMYGQSVYLDKVC